VRFPLTALLLAVACTAQGPKPIRVGEDRCETCLMGIAQERFSSELITRRGKVHTFDSIECLVWFIESEPETADARSYWVTDHEGPPRMLDARKAFYIRSDSIHSPMGVGVAAYADRGTRDAALELLGTGEALDWNEVRAAVRSAWPGGSPHAHGRIGPMASPARPAVSTGAIPASTSIAAAIHAASPGARIVVSAGTYREPAIEIDRPVELVADGRVILDGEGDHGLFVVRADDVTIRGFELRNVGTSFMEDRAAIRVENAKRCVIERNTVENGFFGIYLAGADGCVIRGNRLTATGTRESSSGNGIHLWHSRDAVIADNDIRGYRDGIYFEFVRNSRIVHNDSEANLRYGLHFMFSDSCRYERNVFRANGAGVAVMYAQSVEMTGNTFMDNRGSASFGLLLKDIRDSRIADNTFDGNTVGLYAEDSNRLTVTGNDFTRNGWAIRLMANSENGRYTKNNFDGNTFDVATNSLRNFSEFEGNWWAAYRGYDLDRDGIGDVPHRPVRLFSVIVERNEPLLILSRSFLVGLLDAAESVIPALTPETLEDTSPLMERLVRAPRVAAGDGR